mgnify:FL=1|tara:strand:+ start:338 stop:580 length:243 start_codon:yes stop_codon:yes gene_type:complete
MKTTTWKIDGGFASVVIFVNGNVARSTKLYKTKKGAEAANKRVIEYCGENYANNDFPWETVDVTTGEETRHYIHKQGGKL